MGDKKSGGYESGEAYPPVPLLSLWKIVLCYIANKSIILFLIKINVIFIQVKFTITSLQQTSFLNKNIIEEIYCFHAKS